MCMKCVPKNFPSWPEVARQKYCTHFLVAHQLRMGEKDEIKPRRLCSQLTNDQKIHYAPYISQSS